MTRLRSLLQATGLICTMGGWACAHEPLPVVTMDPASWPPDAEIAPQLRAVLAREILRSEDEQSVAIDAVPSTREDGLASDRPVGFLIASESTPGPPARPQKAPASELPAARQTATSAVVRAKAAPLDTAVFVVTGTTGEPGGRIDVMTPGLPLESVAVVVTVTLEETRTVKAQFRDAKVPVSSNLRFSFSLPEDLPSGAYVLDVEVHGGGRIVEQLQTPFDDGILASNSEYFRIEGPVPTPTPGLVGLWPHAHPVFQQLPWAWPTRTWPEIDLLALLSPKKELPPTRPVVQIRIARFEENGRSPVFSNDPKVLAATIASQMEGGPEALLVLHGYADRTGPSTYNCRLGASRARRVKKVLAEYIPELESRIRTISHGESIDPRYGLRARRVEYSIVTPNTWVELHEKDCRRGSEERVP